MPATIDSPTPRLPVDPLCFVVRGWVWLEGQHDTIAAIEVWAGGAMLGETAALFPRPDAAVGLNVPADTRLGFEIFAHHGGAPFGHDLSLQLRARARDGTRSDVLARTATRTISRDYRTMHFGILLDERTTAIQREENIFATGPSQGEGSPEVAALLRRYLGPPPRRIVDVGCGFGSYGRTLIADGYDWLGVEIDAADCTELARLGLPHRQVDGSTMPFPDASFDAALCIEVLEHIDDTRSFLAEVHRVCPRQLIVSVPNCELLTYFSPYLATPWHMLESTHVNYFTRWSLGALLREFYPHVELRFHTPAPLRTVEGTPLFYNLLAIASSAP